LPARRGFLGQPIVRLGGRKIGPRLMELVVDLGRVDLREELPGLHVSTDVRGPAFEITVGARVDRSVDERLHVAGQNQLLAGIACLGSYDRNGGNVERLRFLLQRCSGLEARENPPDQCRCKDGDDKAYRNPAMPDSACSGKRGWIRSHVLFPERRAFFFMQEQA
jgi:hypothetical protein